MMIFLRSLTGTITIEKPKNPENKPKTWYVNENLFNIYDILYIVGKVLENSVQ